MPTDPVILEAIASGATALGVALVGWQLWITHRQAVTQFEDTLAHEYREIVQRLPLDALLGKQLSPEQLREALEEFYHYVDLTNEQIFLRRTAASLRLLGRTGLMESERM